MRRVEVDSGPVRSIGFDAEREVLEIEWRSGRTYQYFGVPAAVHGWIMRIDDKQGIVERMVKGRYDYVEVTENQALAVEDLAEALARSLAELDARKVPDDDR